MHQEVKSINAPLHRDPGPSSSQPPSAVPPYDHQKPARVPHAPTGALFFRSVFFVFTVFLEESSSSLGLDSSSSSSSIQTLSSRARAAKPGLTRARAWPNNKRAEPEQPRPELGSARLHPYLCGAGSLSLAMQNVNLQITQIQILFEYFTHSTLISVMFQSPMIKP
jgi:hypothetical protein